MLRSVCFIILKATGSWVGGPGAGSPCTHTHTEIDTQRCRQTDRQRLGGRERERREIQIVSRKQHQTDQ